VASNKRVGTMRDITHPTFCADFAALEQLFVLSNSQIWKSINALLIQQQLTQGERLLQLSKVAISQMRSLAGNKNLKQLK